MITLALSAQASAEIPIMTQLRTALSASATGRRRLPSLPTVVGLLFALPAHASELQDAAGLALAAFGFVSLIAAAWLARTAIDAWDRRREARRLTRDGQILRELNRGRTTR